MEKSNKIGVIYTCITGNYDDLIIHDFINPEWDYVCFTDNEDLLNNKNSLWEVRPLKFKELDNVRNSRWHKLHPHLLFSEYEKSLWIDANINITGKEFFNDVNNAIEEKSLISIPKHPERDCIYDEAIACVQQGKDTKEVIESQIKIIKSKNFPEQYGLFETNIIYREHNNEKVIKVMQEWWWWIEYHSRRDQLSLNYVLWLNDFKVRPLIRIGMLLQNGIYHSTKEELIIKSKNLDKELDDKNQELNNLNEIVKQKELEVSIKDNELNKLSEIVNQKNQEIDSKINELSAIYSSRSWKVIVIVQKILNILVPKGSLRRKIAGYIFRFCKKIFKLILNPKKIIIKLGSFFKKILPESIKSKIRPFIIKLNYKYKKSISNIELSKEELEKQKNVKFDYSPLISIIVPTYNTPKNLLDAMIKSVIDQTYSNWELCIADGSKNKETRNILKEYSKKDSRIKIIFLEKNEGISGNSNQAINVSTGEYIAFLDHDDTLTSFALYEVVSVLNVNNKIDVIYSDEDKILSNGKDRFCPFFKPDWSPEFLRGTMYIGHFLVVKKSLAIYVGLLNGKFDKIQDYEFMLRLSEKTDDVYHISKILYHWRSIPGSIASNSQAKGDIDNLQEIAVNDHLKRIGLNAFSKNNGIPHRLNIYPIEKKEYPLVSIIIPTKNNGEILDNCLKSIFNKTNYPNYEVILVDNNTTEKKAIEVMKKYSVKIIKYDNEFNFSKVNNIGVKNANGEYLIFLNNDTEIIEGNWIKNMLYYAEQKDVGAVGPMLLYKDNTIQHAGVVLGFRGTADHVMRDFSNDGDGYFGSLCCAREVSAVTAACMMMKKSIFEEIEGFNEHYNTIYQDVDLCLKIRNKNYRIIYTPLAKLIHHESKSRGDNYDYLDRLLLLDLWESIIKKGDPYYNINFDLNKYSKGYTGYNL